MVALCSESIRRSQPETSPIEGNALAFLNQLRFAALKCRSRPRGNLFEACALLAVERTQSFEAHAEALMQCLNDALGTRAVLYRPGIEETSFDEAWLLSLASALAEKDHDSAQFLLRSRVTKEHQRHVRFLVGRISEYLASD